MKALIILAILTFSSHAHANTHAPYLAVYKGMQESFIEKNACTVKMPTIHSILFYCAGTIKNTSDNTILTGLIETSIPEEVVFKMVRVGTDLKTCWKINIYTRKTTKLTCN